LLLLAVIGKNADADDVVVDRNFLLLSAAAEKEKSKML
jgi:hypothetical protein